MVDMTLSPTSIEVGVDDRLTRNEFSRVVGIAPRTALDWENKGFGPKPVRVSSRVAHYSKRETLNFLQSRRAAR